VALTLIVEQLRMLLRRDGGELVALGVGAVLVRESVLASLTAQQKWLRCFSRGLQGICIAIIIAVSISIAVMSADSLERGLVGLQWMGMGPPIGAVYLVIGPLFFEFVLSLQVDESHTVIPSHPALFYCEVYSTREFLHAMAGIARARNTKTTLGYLQVAAALASDHVMEVVQAAQSVSPADIEQWEAKVAKRRATHPYDAPPRCSCVTRSKSPCLVDGKAVYCSTK
jgi:hypothetical protein